MPFDPCNLGGEQDVIADPVLRGRIAGRRMTLRAVLDPV
jgi:hypothetical protein